MNNNLEKDNDIATKVIARLSGSLLSDNEIDEIFKQNENIKFEDIKTLKNIFLSFKNNKEDDFILKYNAYSFLGQLSLMGMKIREFCVEQNLTPPAIAADINDTITKIAEQIANDVCPIILKELDPPTLFTKRIQREEWTEENIISLNQQNFNEYKITDEPKDAMFYSLYKYPLQRVVY